MSIFHNVVVIEEGLLQQGMDEDGNREKDQLFVNVPKQIVAYYEMFCLIDKGNGVKSGYTLAKGSSKTLGWTLKLLF